MKNKYEFQFPRIDISGYSMDETISIQVAKICEETAEVVKAMTCEPYGKLVEETYDVIQACETLLRYIEEDPTGDWAEYAGVDIHDKYLQERAKNASRGYYGRVAR